MMDMITFNAGMQTLRALHELLKAGYSVRNANEIAARTAEALSQLSEAWTAALTAQQEQLALTKRVSELEKEIAARKDWDREAERYQLGELAPSVPAYVLKPSMEHGEPAHHLCANCFARREKTFLQRGPAPYQVSCSQCKGNWFMSVAPGGPRRVVRT